MTKMQEEIQRILTTYQCITACSIPPQSESVRDVERVFITSGKLTMEITTIEQLQEFESYCKAYSV